MELYYGDFGPSALYPKTVISHEDYILSERELSPWTAVDGWRLELCWHDLLRVLYLGICRIVNASCIVEIWEDGWLQGGSAEEKPQNLTKGMQSSGSGSKDHPVRQASKVLQEKGEAAQMAGMAEVLSQSIASAIFAIPGKLSLNNAQTYCL